MLNTTLPTVNIPCYTTHMNIIVDTEITRLAETLNRLSSDYLPRAVAEALNAPAGLIEIHAKTEAKKDLIVRTPFTTNSIRQVGFARGKNINRMYSLVGSNSPYLYKHDKGETVKAKRSRIPIPMDRTRIGNDLRRQIRSKYRMNAMGGFKSNPTYFSGVPRGTIKGNKRVVGIYERSAGNTKLKLLRSLKTSKVKIPPTNWYTDTLKKYGTEKVVFDAFKMSAERMIAEAGVR